MPKPVRVVLIASLLATFPAAFATAQDTPAKAPAAVEQPTILVTSVVPGFVAKDGVINGAVVQFDLLNGDLRKALAGQSTRLVIDIDCGGEKIRARNMIVYKEPKQAGTAAEVRIKDDWESYHGGAYLADVARSICHQDGGKVAASPSASRPAGTAPLLARSPMPAARRESPGTHQKDTGTLIQFVSSSSEAEVQADIAKLRAKLGAQIGQMQFSVHSAVVKGLKHHRGRLGPFSSKNEADQFCSKIVELHFQCLVTHDPN